MAIMVTKAYAGDYGTAWNEAAYHKAISSILISDTQTLKLAMGPNNIPMAMINDCSECETQGACAVETPITLDDIQCMVRNLGISWQVFFGEKIDPLPSTMTSGLKLIRDKHCTIRETRAMHCRFTPCPGRVQNKEAITCFYLGSGTVEEQFRHQISLDITRQYVRECGIKYDKAAVTKALQVIDRLFEDRAALEDFCNSIAPFRYVDDTLPLRNPNC